MFSYYFKTGWAAVFIIGLDVSGKTFQTLIITIKYRI